MSADKSRRIPPVGTVSAAQPQVDSRYGAHPLLDPSFPGRAPGLARHWVRVFRQLPPSGTAPYELFARLLQPHPATTDLRETTCACLRDVDSYLDDVLRFVPAESRSRLRPLPAVRALDDPAELLRLCFAAPDPRFRYEAQRKLYLGRLLLSIDHWRAVRDGQRHRAILEDHLERTLLGEANAGHETEVCYRFVPDGAARGSLRKTAGAGEDAQCWRFHPRILPAGNGWPKIEILQHHCRFKREADDAVPNDSPLLACPPDGPERWPKLGRRSGSILSKMIRKGITDPHQVQDILGAMFIVADCKQAYALEQRLVGVLGGPAWVRDRTDTLAGERDRDLLSQRSAVGFEVLKETVDILVDDPGAGPYQFSVELQIYPLTSYLATVHDAHYASHAAYKRRQFTEDILPTLFPEAIFNWVPRQGSPAAPVRSETLKG